MKQSTMLNIKNAFKTSKHSNNIKSKNTLYDLSKNTSPDNSLHYNNIEANLATNDLLNLNEDDNILMENKETTLDVHYNPYSRLYDMNNNWQKTSLIRNDDLRFNKVNKRTNLNNNGKNEKVQGDPTEKKLKRPISAVKRKNSSDDIDIILGINKVDEWKKLLGSNTNKQADSTENRPATVQDNKNRQNNLKNISASQNGVKAIIRQDSKISLKNERTDENNEYSSRENNQQNNQRPTSAKIELYASNKIHNKNLGNKTFYKHRKTQKDEQKINNPYFKKGTVANFSEFKTQNGMKNNNSLLHITGDVARSVRKKVYNIESSNESRNFNDKVKNYNINREKTSMVYSSYVSGKKIPGVHNNTTPKINNANEKYRLGMAKFEVHIDNKAGESFFNTATKKVLNDSNNIKTSQKKNYDKNLYKGQRSSINKTIQTVNKENLPNEEQIIVKNQNFILQQDNSSEKNKDIHSIVQEIDKIMERQTSIFLSKHNIKQIAANSQMVDKLAHPGYSNNSFIQANDDKKTILTSKSLHLTKANNNKRIDNTNINGSPLFYLNKQKNMESFFQKEIKQGVLEFGGMRPSTTDTVRNYSLDKVSFYH